MPSLLKFKSIIFLEQILVILICLLSNHLRFLIKLYKGKEYMFGIFFVLNIINEFDLVTIS
jgi:hypothetical protein